VILSEDGFLHEVSVGHVAIVDGSVKTPWLLRVAPAGSVIPREGLEGTNLMPSGAELSSC
jgi:hypothetical protein